jgi:hypothetical protein
MIELTYLRVTGQEDTAACLRVDLAESPQVPRVASTDSMRSLDLNWQEILTLL